MTKSKKLTPKQKTTMDRLDVEGPIFCRDGQFELVKTGRKIHTLVVKNLIEKQLLVGGNDGLFPDSPPQTLHKRNSTLDLMEGE
ncbi:MAG: hypothetical protein ABJN40_05890 [Sneathiella sp.]